MSDISNMSAAFLPKSDQLNSDQLTGSSITIKISAVSTEVSDGKVRAVLNYENDQGRPYKPCLGMGRVILEAWGNNGNDWIGRSMTLYRDPTIMFGKDQVGGIRISHMSHIKGNFTAFVTVKRGRKTAYPIKLLEFAEQKQPKPYNHAAALSAISQAADVETLNRYSMSAQSKAENDTQIEEIIAASVQRSAELSEPINEQTAD